MLDVETLRARREIVEARSGLATARKASENAFKTAELQHIENERVVAEVSTERDRMASSLDHRPDGRLGKRRTPQVGVYDGAGQVEDRAHVGLH